MGLVLNVVLRIPENLVCPIFPENKLFVLLDSGVSPPCVHSPWFEPIRRP